jgi:hypothetical protein
MGVVYVAKTAVSALVLTEIQTPLLHMNPGLTVAYEPIQGVTAPTVAVTINTVINMMTYGSKFKLAPLLHRENA